MIAKNGYDFRNYSRFAVCRDKKFLDKDWHKGKDKKYCDQQIQSGRANGYGLITGEFDGFGLVAIDFDGESASGIAKAIGAWLLNQDTMTWTSGKVGHHQKCYQIPKAHLPFWTNITKHDLAHLKGYNCTNGEHLEIRYNNHASVLPPSVHPETGYYKWTNEIAPRELSYSESYDLLNICTTWQKSDISDSQELNLIEEALSYITSDDYHTWITIGMALYNHGVDFAVWENWSSKSAKYDGKGLDSKWSSFKGGGRLTIGTLFHLAKCEGFDQVQWMRQNLRSNKVALNKTLERSNPDIAENNIIALTRELVERLAKPDIGKDKRDMEVALFCHQYRVSERAINKAIDSKIEYDYKESELENLDYYLDNLINIPKKKLDLSYLLGCVNATYFIDQARSIPTNPDALLFSFLPQIATLIGTHNQVVIVNKSTNWIVKPIIRTAIVADSGSAKSAVLKNATEGINQINNQNLKQYYNEVRTWELLSPEEKFSYPKPLKNQIVLKDFNFEGLYKCLSENRHGSALIIRDELKGYFNVVISKNGRGDEVQKDLELFEGEEIIKTRQGDEFSVYIPNSTVSMTGCLQWYTLERIFNHDDDVTGVSPRWLFYCGNLPEYKIMPHSDDDTWTQFNTQIAEYLLNPRTPMATELTLSQEAFEYMQNWFNVTRRDTRLKANYLQIASKETKIVADIIKIAQCLHNLFLVTGEFELAPQSDIIDIGVMERAIYFCEFALAHFIYGFTKCQEGLLDAQLTRILEIVNKKGECTAKELKNALGGVKCKLSIMEVGELALQLVTLKKLDRVATKKGVKVKKPHYSH
jgi:hypothetical protein